MDAFLPPADIITCFAIHLPPNEVAANLRLVCKAFAHMLSSYVHIKLFHPVPHHAFLWRWCSPIAMRPLPLSQRLKLLCLVAYSGCLDNLQAALEATGLDLSSGKYVTYIVDGRCWDCNPKTAAAKGGHLHVCEWLQNQGCPWKDTLVAAASAGHQEVCRWALAAGCPWDVRAPVFAARGGHMELAEELLTHHPLQPNTQPVAEFLAGVAYSCNLGTLQREVQRWSGEQGPQQQVQGHQFLSSLQSIVSAAAGSPTPDWQAKVNWLEQQGYPTSAACYCHELLTCPDAVERLAWLLQQGYPVNDRNAIAAAAQAGRTAVLEGLLTEAEGVDDGRVAIEVASKGDLATLRVLHRWGWMVDTWPCAAAALSNGWFETVVWMVEEAGVRLSKNSLNHAMVSGNLELVEWVLERGFTWDDGTLYLTAACGWVTMLERLVEQGCPVPDDGSPYIKAAHNGDLATLACLQRLGVPWGSNGMTLARCVPGAPLSALRWLLAAVGPVDVQEAERASEANMMRRADGQAVRELLMGLGGGAASQGVMP